MAGMENTTFVTGYIWPCRNSSLIYWNREVFTRNCIFPIFPEQLMSYDISYICYVVKLMFTSFLLNFVKDDCVRRFD